MAGGAAKAERRQPVDVEGPADDRALLGRAGTAERVADILRDRITEGHFPPGVRLSEESIGGALGVSRNTLREAFRLLTHERLLVHRLNRGVFVRVVTVEDLADIYRVRLLVECAAVRGLGQGPYDEGTRAAIGAIEAAVRSGEAAVRERAWQELSTANIRFHQGVAALADSPRTDELMRAVLAELRLVFHVMDDPRRFHAPYLTRNRQIVEALEDGDAAAAEQLLRSYLEDSLAQLSGAYARLIAEG
ncbi:GntR family transcriptional regulator [Streptomyces sp. NPDC014733]|uniref:GntR family transcriptional regulator n=1 Tax=Streptomyces sp. NPDC014733 TaxID=3364885 RepID=UPI0036FB0263